MAQLIRTPDPDPLYFKVERILEIVESEPELPGPIPDDTLALIKQIGLEAALRSAVSGTKRCIVRRIKEQE